jgi:uncharacterized protein YegL
MGHFMNRISKPKAGFLLCFISILFIVSPDRVFSFGGKTHRFIAEQALEKIKISYGSMVSKYYNPEIDINEFIKYKDIIIQWSADEDNYNYTNIGCVSKETLLNPGEWGWCKEPGVAARDHFWDADNDKGYPLVTTKKACDKAEDYSLKIKEKYGNDKTEAYKFFGALIHLLSDMGSPAHVHVDGHALCKDNIPKLNNVPDVIKQCDYIEHYAENNENYKKWKYDNNPIPSYSNLREFMYQLNQRADFFPSNDYNGDEKHDGSLPDNWHQNWEVYTNKKLAEDADDSLKEKICSILVPLTINYVAGLYKLCWDQTHPKHFLSPSSYNAIALVLDRSGSMTGEKLAKAKEAAKAFVQTLNPSDQASVSLFSENASTVVEMGTVSSTLGTMDTAISGVAAETSTNIGSGLEQALMQLEKASTEQGKKISLLMSDGMNNRGDWHPAVNTFIAKKWRVYTVGFGKDADEAALRKIAESTNGTFWPADMVNLTNVYQIIGAHAQNKSVLLSTSESLAPNGKLSYRLPVTQGAQNLNVFTNWQGSRLLTALVSPSGETMAGDQLLKSGGRYSEGRIFQMFEVTKPQAGEWRLDVSWAEPPPAPEQVNIAVSEKSDIFTNLLGFRAEYKIGEPVIINVQAAEVIGDMDKSPLKKSSVKVQIQKPGPQMIQMVQSQSSNWTMYKEVMLDVTRSLVLSDDGSHSDYNAGDGIFGNAFTETDKNGAYLVTAIVSGEKSNGEKIEKKLQGSFQVGPISKNPVTNSQVLQYMNQAQPHINNTTPYSKEILDQPKQNIDQMQGNPLDSIDKILKKK